MCFIYPCIHMHAHIHPCINTPKCTHTNTYIHTYTIMLSVCPTIHQSVYLNIKGYVHWGIQKILLRSTRFFIYWGTQNLIIFYIVFLGCASICFSNLNILQIHVRFVLYNYSFKGQQWVVAGRVGTALHFSLQMCHNVHKNMHTQNEMIQTLYR